MMRRHASGAMGMPIPFEPPFFELIICTRSPKTRTAAPNSRISAISIPVPLIVLKAS